MANSKDFEEGYKAAIEQLKRMLNGNKQNNQNSSGSGQDMSKMKDSDGNPMQQPELNPSDAKKAEKNAKQNGSSNETGNSQAEPQYRQEAAEASVSPGGFISQEAGAAIAKSEGYDDEDCKVESQSSVANQWKQDVITACSRNNNPGIGHIVSRLKDVYITNHDWKGDLKKYVGRALNNIDVDTRYGNKKWLAQGEIKKRDIPKDNGLDDIIFLIDCSGSVSDELLQALCSECYTIVKKKGINNVTYAYYDDGIRQIDSTRDMKNNGILDPSMVSKIKSNSKKPTSEIHGRGGNRESKVMEDIIEICKKKRINPELVMWFTDGYTNSIPKKPRIIKNMIWVVYDNNDFEAPDSSRVIHIKSSDIVK